MTRMAREGREGYKHIRDRIHEADVVHLNEAWMSPDGEQGRIRTFKTAE